MPNGIKYTNIHMEDISKQIEENKAAAEGLTKSAEELEQKIKKLNEQQATYGFLTKEQSARYKELKAEISETSQQLTRLNVIVGDQERALASAKSRTEAWGKAYEGAMGTIGSMQKILEGAGGGFKPLAENIEKATKVVSPFKDAISKADKTYTTYAQSVASGNSRMEAFKETFPGLAKVMQGGTASVKALGMALAETGIGLIVIAVAALIQKMQEFKPVMDAVKAVTAAVSAAMSALGSTIYSWISGSDDMSMSMTEAAKAAYKLSSAQDELATKMKRQELVNDVLKEQIALLKEQAGNTKLSAADRIKALAQQHAEEEKYYNQNFKLAKENRNNAMEEAGINAGLSRSIIDDLKKRGMQAAISLLEMGNINQEQFDSIKKANDAIRALNTERTANIKANSDAVGAINDEEASKDKERREKAAEKYREELKAMKAYIADAEKITADSIMRNSIAALKGYELEVKQAELHYGEQLKKYTDFVADYDKADKAFKAKHKKEYEASKAAIVALETEKGNALNTIAQKFRDGDLQKLNGYASQLKQQAEQNGKKAHELAMAQLKTDEQAKQQEIDNAIIEGNKRIDILNLQLAAEKNEKRKEELKREIEAEKAAIVFANNVKKDLQQKLDDDTKKIREEEAARQTQERKKNEDDTFQKAVSGAHDNGDWQQEFKLKQDRLDAERAQAVAAAHGNEAELLRVKLHYDGEQRKLNEARHQAQLASQKNYLKSVDSMATTLGNLFGKNTVAAKVAFKAHQAAAAGQVIIDTQKSIMGIWSANSSIPFVGTAKAIIETAIVAATGATSLTNIIKQKPGFAQGGQFVSDGKGALLPGYSRTDNTNAYLRSGEAVVVSEAMRNPWARNLVSAVNVAYGGRDFSTNSGGNAYALGGVFTDGGNANRYYNQPVSDVKDLANTLAYQMVNNFPPIYVDVKDVNNQQNILAQTVNRVNL